MSISSLRAELTCPVLIDGDDGFAAAASPLNPPLAIVQPSTVDDVVAAIRFATSTGISVSVRSGGHTGGGWVSGAGALDLDMSGFAEISVEGSLATVGTGASWGAVAATLADHGLALTSGDTKSVGVGGLTLGGGFGWLIRQYGLALDSLVSARVATSASGLVTASADENPELFWAIRGGGGNFGVVIDFTFQAHPLDGVVHGVISFNDTEIAPMLAAYRDVMREAPEKLNVTFMLWPPMGPEMPGGPQLHVLYGSSDEKEAMAAIAPLLAIPGASGHDISAKPYADALEDPHAPEPGTPMPVIVGSNGLARELTDETIVAIGESVDGMGAGAILMIRYVRGAFNRVDADSTAFAWRDAEALVIGMAFLPPDADPELIERTEAAWLPVAAHTTGTYGNFLGYAGEKAVGLMYPPATRARLAAAKREWDPQNLFRHNQNVQPA